MASGKWTTDDYGRKTRQAVVVGGGSGGSSSGSASKSSSRSSSGSSSGGWTTDEYGRQTRQAVSIPLDSTAAKISSNTGLGASVSSLLSAASKSGGSLGSVAQMGLDYLDKVKKSKSGSSSGSSAGAGSTVAALLDAANASQGVQQQAAASPWQYKITSRAGIEQANSMLPGEVWKNPNDGSTWTRNADGTIDVVSASGNVTRGAYTVANTPAAQDNPYNDAYDKIMEYYEDLQSRSTPTFNSEWQGTAGDLLKAALGMNYEDFLRSGQYSALSDRYARNGQLAMQDTLAQIAARTGGLASSYATSVAQQRYNDYMAQLEDAARAMYSSERADAIQNAGLAADYADKDYQAYLDRLAQYDSDRSFGYGVLSDALKASQYGAEWQNTLDNQAYNRRQAEEQTAYERQQAADALRRSQDLQRLETYTTTAQNYILQNDTNGAKKYIEYLVDTGVISEEEALNIATSVGLY